MAGRATDDGQVDVEQLSACNNLLFKSEKPPRVRAEESLYAAKNGDMSHVFDSMDPEVYAAQQEIFAKGDIKGCKNVQDAYNKAMAQARPDKKVYIKANAILSNQVEFSQKQITDFAIELMHSIDSSTGAGLSSHQSGSNTTDADYKIEQLKAILTNHPEIINDVKAKVQKEDFTFDVTTDAGDMVISNRHDNKQKYLDIINNTNTVAKDAIFYDEKGNKITDPAQIEALTKANMNSLQGLRQYVAELERDFKMGVDEEGAFSDAANGLIEYSGLGTGRGEVANNYRYAKNLLKELELAAQGKLRDSNGKVISAQQLAKKVQNEIGKLSQSNADYKSSINTAKMGMVLAPVIVVTTVATGGAAAVGWGTTATVAGVTTAVVEGSIQATELLTSETGNTAENRASATQQVLWDSALAATGTKIGQLSERMVQSGLKMTSAAAERMLIQQGLNANSARLISKSPNAVSTVLRRAEEISTKIQQTKLNQVMTAAGDKFVDKGAQLISKQTALLNKVAPNLNPETARKVSVILARTEAAGFEVTSDSVQSLVQMYCQEGKFDETSFTQGMIMSIAGNTIGHMTSGVGDLRPQPKVEPQGVLEHATGNGSHQSGGKLNAEKMDLARQQVADVAQHGSPQEVAHVHNEADLQQAQSRPQGRELKHVIEDNAGFVAIGKERIALDSSDIDALARAKKEVSNWTDGTRDKEAILAKINKRMDEINAGQVKPTEPARGVDVVEHINDKVNQNAEHILDGNTGAIGSHDAATLRDQLANNLKSEGEIEQFIADIKQRVGVDEKGNMHVYQVQGKDHAADLVNAAEKKLKDIKANKANFEEASSILDKANAAGKGLSEDELKTLKSVAGKMTDSESLQSLIDKMKSNKKIKGHSGAKKAIGEMEAQVQTLKKAEAGHVQKAQTAEEPQGASDKPVADFAAEQRRMVEEGKLNSDGTPIETQPKVKQDETPATHKVEEPQGVSDKPVADFAAEQRRMVEEGKLNPDGTPIETQPKVKADETPIEAQPKAESKETPAAHNADEPQGAADGAVADFAAEQRRMIAEGKLNPDGTPIETQPKVKADETPAVRNASEQKVSDAPANSAEVKQAAVEVELTPQKVAGMKKDAVALDKEIKASSEIPAQQKQLWTSVKEKYEVILDSVKSMKDGIKSSGIATYCKDVLQGLRSIAKTAPKAIKEKLAKMAKNIQAIMAKHTSKPAIDRGVLDERPVQKAERLFNDDAQVIFAEPVIEAHFTADNFKVGDKLPKGKGVIVASNAKLLLADKVEVDLSSPKIQSKLKNLKDGQSLTIGREGDIVVGANNSTISRKHLTIEKSGNEIIVKDISTNGTKFKSLGDEVQILSVEPGNNYQRVNNSRRSNNSNFQGLSEDIKSTFSENTQQNLKKLKNGQSVSLTKGDRHYVVKNNNGQIVIETSLDANELVRVKGNNGKEINSNYVQTSVEAREYLQDAIEFGQYTDSFESYVQTMNNMHKVSATGRNGNNEWYSEAGNGSNSVNPGQIRGRGYMVNHRTNTAIEAEEIAKQYGDSYRVETTKSQVNLKGIPDKYKPTDYNYGEHSHQYPDGEGLGYYYKEMHRTAKETLDLINKGASEQKILKKIAEHYQYAANARPYGQINNSLFMNEINTLLQKAGLKTIPHGNLDQISMHLQPETFQKYFIDQYYQTAL